MNIAIESLFFNEDFNEKYCLRDPSLGDAESLYENVTSDPEVTRYLSWLPHKSRQETEQFIEKAESSNATNSGNSHEAEHTWIIVERETSQALGLFSIWRDNNFSIELGFCLGRAWWGKGIMLQTVRSVISTLERDSDLYRVWATCDVENLRSAKLLEKIGMSFEGKLRRHGLRPNMSNEPRSSFLYAIAIR